MIVGFPPYYTENPTSENIYKLIKSKPILFPELKRHGFEVSKMAKDFII